MIMNDSLPGIKRFFHHAALSPIVLDMLIRFAVAFIHHYGRMSATQAAGAIRAAARHRAALVRFLADSNWSKDWSVLTTVADLLLPLESRQTGTWAFILDQTFCGHQGSHTENTFSRGNYHPRPRKGNRHNKKHSRHSCHCFIVGLLITPGGLRIPCCRCYFTETYCKAERKTYRTQTELAAELVDQLAVPEHAKVVVLGDTSFDAKDIRAVCQKRGFHWMVPVNPERVLAGAKPRPKVKSLAQKFSSDQFAPVRLVPAKEPFAAQRRVARCRLGPKMKGRTYYVHEERQDVHSIGEVLLIFSMKEKPELGKRITVQKILMTDDLSLTATRVVQLYDLRWQIELFFKELKSTLGLAQYRFRKFTKVEGWVQSCLVTFVYLEWYRACQLRQRGRDETKRRWWHSQRSHGLCQAIRQDADDNDLEKLRNWSQTKTGLRRLKKCLHAALPLEYRKPLKNQRKHAA